MRVKNGKIVYQGDYYDGLGFQKQLGWIFPAAATNWES